MPISTVSRSRISPTSTTLGPWRSAALSKDVHAETSFLSKRIGTVARSAPDQIFRQTTIPIDDVERKSFGLKWRQLLDARLNRDGHELARGFDLQRLIHRDIEVRYILVRIQHRCENVVEF